MRKMEQFQRIAPLLVERHLFLLPLLKLKVKDRERQVRVCVA